jgi:hypothetical protein
VSKSIKRKNPAKNPEKGMITRNDTLMDISETLRDLSVWDKYRDEARARYVKGKKDSPARIVSKFSEVHQRTLLERICEERENCEFDPIDLDYQGLFQFKRTMWGAIEVKKEGEEHSEMDGLIVVDNLPVLVEVKLSKSPSQVDSWVNPSKLEKRLEPLMEYFGVEETGCLVVAPENIIIEESYAQQEFIERGGIIVPFCKSAEKYYNLAKYCLKLVSKNFNPYQSKPQD